MKRLERGLLIHSTCLLSLSPLAKVEGETGLGVEATPERTGVETDLTLCRPLTVLGDHGHVADLRIGYGCHLGVISGKCAG